MTGRAMEILILAVILTVIASCMSERLTTGLTAILDRAVAESAPSLR